MSDIPNEKRENAAITTNPIVAGFGEWLKQQNLSDFAALNGIYHGAQLSVAVIGLFIINDLVLMLPDRLPEFIPCLVIRLVMLMSCAIFLRWNHVFYEEEGRESRKNESVVAFRVVVGLLLVQVIGNGISCIGYIIDGSESNYFGGVIMTFIAVVALVPINSTMIGIQVGFMCLFYYVTLCCAEGKMLPSVPALSNMTIMIGGASVSWFCSKMMSSARVNGSKIVPQARPAASPKKIRDLVQVDLGIGGSVVTLVISNYLDRRVPDRRMSLGAIAIIGAGDADESIEFRNTCRFAINLKHAQMFIPSSDSRYKTIDVDAKYNGSVAILPGGKFRIYSKGMTNVAYRLDFGGEITNLSSVLEKVMPSTIRLVGFRLPSEQ